MSTHDPCRNLPSELVKNATNAAISSGSPTRVTPARFTKIFSASSNPTPHSAATYSNRFANRPVRTVPGFTAFTCIPSAIPTAANAFVSDNNAAFTDPPTANSAPGVLPPVPAMFTNDPPAAANAPHEARANRTAAKYFNANPSVKSSSANSKNAPLFVAPALFTTMSIRPVFSNANSASLPGASVSRKSNATANPPISNAASSNSDPVRAHKITRAPSAANRPAIARPIPIDAPVTIAVFPKCLIGFNLPNPPNPVLPTNQMKSYRKELWFHLPARMEFTNITPQITECLRESGIREGLCLVNAMHITASVFINDDESGLHADYKRWLEHLAPHAPTEQYLHNRTGEDNADAHMKRQIMGREVVVAVTNAQLDFGPWEQIFYGEFDGRRKKRVLVKIIGD